MDWECRQGGIAVVASLSTQQMTHPKHDPKGAMPTCAKCGDRPSTHHICQITGGNMEVLDLCEACASDWRKSSAIRFPDVRNEACFYCGAPAASGGMNQEWEKRTRGRDFHFTCTTCFETYSRLFLEWMETMPADLPPEAQIGCMSKAIGEIDGKVREGAAGSKG